jgi:hypothetical protein
MPDDTGKPTDTTPAGPPVIEAGHAREAVLVALANVARAMGELESTAVAVARQLDATDAEIKAMRQALDATVAT